MSGLGYGERRLPVKTPSIFGLCTKKLDAPFTYQSGKVLETIVGAGAVRNLTGGLKVFYYTKEYGTVRWEGWDTNGVADLECMATSVMALDSDW